MNATNCLGTVMEIIHIMTYKIGPYSSFKTAKVQIQEELFKLSTYETLEVNFKDSDRLTTFWL